MPTRKTKDKKTNIAQFVSVSVLFAKEIQQKENTHWLLGRINSETNN